MIKETSKGTTHSDAAYSLSHSLYIRAVLKNGLVNDQQSCNKLEEGVEKLRRA